MFLFFFYGIFINIIQSRLTDFFLENANNFVHLAARWWYVEIAEIFLREGHVHCCYNTCGRKPWTGAKNAYLPALCVRARGGVFLCCSADEIDCSTFTPFFFFGFIRFKKAGLKLVRGHYNSVGGGASSIHYDEAAADKDCEKIMKERRTDGERERTCARAVETIENPRRTSDRLLMNCCSYILYRLRL